MFVRIRQLARWRPPRWTRNVAGTIVFSAALATHTAYLARTGRLARCESPRTTASNPELLFEISATPERIVVSPPWIAVERTAWHDPATTAQLGFAADPEWGPRDRGRWARTARIWDTTIPMSATVAAADAPAVRAEVIRWVNAEAAAATIRLGDDTREWLRRLQRTDAVVIEPTPRGYLHNTIALGLLILALRPPVIGIGRCLAAVGRCMQRWQEDSPPPPPRFCWNCRYDIASLPSNICPECGSLIRLSGARPAHDS